jgi:hypothetical protein
MNRKSFFKRLFLGAAAVVVAPKILAEVKTKPIAVTWADPNVSELLVMQKELMNSIMNVPVHQWGSFMPQQRSYHLSDLCTNKVPDFSCVNITDAVVNDCENIGLSGEEVTPFLNNLFIAYNKRADELGATHKTKYWLELQRYIVFNKDPMRTGGVIQYIAECNQGLHPAELRNDITLVDFNSWIIS